MLIADLFQYKTKEFTPYWSETGIKLSDKGWNTVLNLSHSDCEYFFENLVLDLNENGYIRSHDGHICLAFHVSKDETQYIELADDLETARNNMIKIIQGLDKFNLNLTPAQSLRRIQSILFQYSQIDGAHHKAWCLDQILRASCGQNIDDYKKFVNQYEYNTDTPTEDQEQIYEWNTGIAP